MYKILTLLFLLSTNVCAESIISKEEVNKLLPTYTDGKVGTDILSKSLIIGDGVKVSYEFEITSKGNGAVILPGILLRLYDSYEDLSYFKNGLLNNEVLDVNSDGYKDILLWGTALTFDDDGNSLGEKEVVAVLVYSIKEQKYVVLKKSEEIDVFPI
ncbi:hypothetical protein [Pseudoalteromonas phenolica]|nr:hypothetical protein [Pseudoalteromonas phenolica]RXF00414.1 hypothetical protein D9981_09515 [Pseudoalteromonas phenolica O-BC30]